MKIAKEIIYTLLFLILLITTYTLNDIEVVGSDVSIVEISKADYELKGLNLNVINTQNDTVLMKNNKIYTDSFSDFVNILIQLRFN